ncbi:MAG: sulfatase family protein [Planctomycetota bacterium]|jgi:N-sulfoglucosamine sulfohydrolase
MDPEASPGRPNVLLITADDLNWDSVGAWGCPVEGATPNIDALAAGGVRFELAHVNIAVCQPSRSAIMTGRYPHRSGGEGFFNLRRPGVPILPELLRAAGDRVGILGKVGHSTPYADFRWDLCLDQPAMGMGRNPAEYGRATGEFVRESLEAGRSFFLMANSHDPHRPFFGNDKPEWYDGSVSPSAARPSRVFGPEEVTVPGFLEDLPEVRQEVAEYYSSVRRCDDTVGAILDAVREAGAWEDTLVIFLSDNGMALPFAKTNCYLHSTRTPWIVSWPEGIAGGAADDRHFVSGIDVLPTVLEAAGVEVPPGTDGSSFLPVLRGEEAAGRELVFTQFFQTAARRNYPMRCVQDRRFGYIFNPWHDGGRVFRNESQAGRTMKAMRAAAETDAAIAQRVRLFLYRVPEELYDFEADPDARRNLIGEAEFAAEADRLRGELEAWMERTGDPALEAFRNRGSREALDAYLGDLAAEIGERSEE